MNEQEKMLNQLQELLTVMSTGLVDVSKQMESISKVTQKELSGTQLEMVNEFKDKLKNLKGVDFSSIMELKEVYEKKLKDGI